MTPVAVDIGNTRIKVYAEGRLLSYPLRDIQAAVQAIDVFPKPRCVGILSVHPATEQALIDALKSLPETVAVRGVDLLEFLPVDFSDVVGMGADRRMAISQAWLSSANNVAVIDSGTALTLTLANRAGRCLGGAIAPGLGTSARALHDFTDALPLVDVTRPRHAAGKNTDEAIRLGIHLMHGACIASYIRHAEKLFGGDVAIWLTGGNSVFFDTSEVGIAVQTDVLLVLKGVERSLGQFM